MRNKLRIKAQRTINTVTSFIYSFIILGLLGALDNNNLTGVQFTLYLLLFTLLTLISYVLASVISYRVTERIYKTIK